MRGKSTKRGFIRRIITVIAVCVMAGMIGQSGIRAFAAEKAVNVTVTISDGKGTAVLAQEPVKVTDADGDGIISINDALICTHDKKYTGGAKDGYLSEKTDFGLSMIRLWGVENGGSYGYYVNHASALSLLDEVKEGDIISAYAYADLTSWSDLYVYFNADTIDLNKANEYTLTLSGAGFDENWNPVVVPVEGAMITFNGKDSGFVTDSEGKVTLTGIPKGVISAISYKQTIVPPVCIAVKTVNWVFPVMIAGAVLVIGIAAVVIAKSKKRS